MRVVRLERWFIHPVGLHCGLLVLLTLFASGAANAASFDCSKARPGVEQAICLDETTSVLDERMAATYKAALSSADVSLVRQSQRDWLRLVRNVCASPECLHDVYQKRIEALLAGRPFELNLAGNMGALYAGLDRLPPGTSYGPASPQEQAIAEWLKASRLLETIIASVGTTTELPAGLRATAQHCGEVNAVYFGTKKTLVLCYELAEMLATQHKSRVTNVDPQGWVETRRFVNGLQFTLLHELGHAVLHLHDKDGLLGREETAADAFAGVVMLRMKANDDEVSDALWGVWTLFQVLKTSGMSHPSDEHEYSEQRLANFECLLGGRSPAFLPVLVKANHLTASRSQRCPREWSSASLGVQALSRKAVAAR